MRRSGAVALGLALALLSSGSAAESQTLGPDVSINIVEPKDQARWGYAPANRTVAPGTWVSWSNNGQDEHTVTAVDGSFDSQNLEPSEGFSYFFDQPGTEYDYTCTLHPWMNGRIVVSGQPSAVSNQPPDGDDASQPDDTPDPDS
jgi:plastocyanin